MGGRLLELHARVRELVREEIGRIVSDACGSGEILHTGRITEHLERIYGASSVSPEHVIDDIVRAAAKAGVAVEMCRTELKRTV